MKKLAIVDIELIRSAFEPGDEPGHYTKWSTIALRAWKVHSIEVLKDSPSAERKYFRWEVRDGGKFRTPAELFLSSGKGVLEVGPDTSSEGY